MKFVNKLTSISGKGLIFALPPFAANSGNLYIALKPFMAVKNVHEECLWNFVRI